MIISDKHIQMNESLVGLGAIILKCLAQPLNIDQLWKAVKTMAKKEKYPYRHKFENLILAMDMLYAIGAISSSKKRPGWYEKCVYSC